ncbi:ABC transporter permease [Fulvivirga sp. RKSG066]|uniref:ABC transporter permease n=1 Tax=Fulvivirga aurantia TaxID=2529383 RepID=UPI0012BC54E6|nr:ABC transporter permease [Fulvivirga aurantia]MTI21703.1 ABC transporter permease [Fulvivirga aurantia]
MTKNLYTYLGKHFIHTFFSVLGLVLGVALLIGTLALTEKVELLALKKVSQTEQLEAVIVESNTYNEVGGVRLRKNNVRHIDYDLLKSLESYITIDSVRAYVESNYPGRIVIATDQKKSGIGLLSYVNETERNQGNMITGRWLEPQDLYRKNKVAVVSTQLSYEIMGDSTGNVVGENISFANETYEVVGLVSTNETTGRAFVPITLLNEEQLTGKTPITVLLAPSIEDVPEVKGQVAEFLKTEFGENQGFFTIVNEQRVRQMRKILFVGKLAVGLTIAALLLGGGIGLMNVLLLSTYKTVLAEGIGFSYFFKGSLLISSVAALLGLIIGVVGSIQITPILMSVLDAPFKPSFSLGMFLAVPGVVLLVSLIFSVYPSMRVKK